MERGPYRQRTRVRAGRTGSLLGGIMGVVTLVVGVSLMGGSLFGSPVGAPPVFVIAWIVICLVISGMSFYNAFSAEGVSLYEIETEARSAPPSEPAAYCPQCGSSVGADDKFCRQCGTRLAS